MYDFRNRFCFSEEILIICKLEDNVIKQKLHCFRINLGMLKFD